MWNLIYQSLDKIHTFTVMESFFIDEHNSFKEGYNSTKGGEGAPGISISESQRKTHSANMKGRSPPNKGKFGEFNHTPETKAKISKSISGEHSPHFDPNVYEFIHDQYGTFKGTKHQLREKYPESNIKLFHLNELVSNTRKSHLGWRYISYRRV